MSRIAWWSEENELIVFANGCHKAAPPDNLSFIRNLCAARRLDREQLNAANLREVVKWLLNVGAFDLFENDESDERSM